MNSRTADHNDVTHLFGTMAEHTLLQILETGATVEQLEAVALWLAQEDDVLGKARVPLDGVRAQVARLLEEDSVYDPEREI